ncbi:epidermal growth factor receptor kinase substrate 8-like protein 1 [Ambystoma mexicanum]|uniref:epidermal growth factor receptor kinase substrate 8-like protein 1 n=1 Tax=Ambystoma mexicanum TaxID=8296 RepID=UPI0037E81C0C
MQSQKLSPMHSPMHSPSGTTNGLGKPSAKSIYEQRKKYSNFIMADISQYHVNHLVTFTIDEDDDVHTVEDAIRKLSVMDTKGKIWVQEMLLQVNTSSVKLLDVESKDELEDYSLGAIERCETVLPAGRARSLLVLVCQDYYQQQPDVHFFQCDQVGAELIKEDINSAMMDLKSGQNLKRPEALRANQEIMSQQNRSPARMSPNVAPGAFSYSPFTQRRQLLSEPVGPSDVLQRGASRYAPIQAVTVVGARPQIVLANNDIYSLPKKTPTMGQLVQGSQGTLPGPKLEAMQAGPAQQRVQTGQVVPTEQLNGLSMVDGASQMDSAALRYEREVDLLNHNFDDIESFVGKLQKSAEAFKVLDQRKKTRRNKKTASGEGLLTIRAKPPTLEEYIAALQKFKYCFSLLARLKTNIVNPSSTELAQFLFSPLKTVVDSSGGVQLAQEVKAPMLTKEAISLLKESLNDQQMELWQSLGPNWTQPRVEFGRDYAIPYTPTFLSGWEPPQYDSDGNPWEDPVEVQHRHEELRSQQSVSQIVRPPPLPTVNGHGETDVKRMLCSYEFVARNSNELSVLQGEVLQVIDDSKKWWKVQNNYGLVGYVPYNILAPAPAAEASESKMNGPASPANPQFKKTPPPTPPKKNGNMQMPVQWGSMDSLNVPPKSEPGKTKQVNSMNEELLLRLANGRTAPQKSFSVQRTSDTSMTLSDESSPSEVKAWLQAKGFSPLTVNSLGVLNGAQLFTLRKEEFKAVSPDEGARVYSQVMVQKALLEDSRKISELEAVMEKQKKKVDEEIEQVSF